MKLGVLVAGVGVGDSEPQQPVPDEYFGAPGSAPYDRCGMVEVVDPGGPRDGVGGFDFGADVFAAEGVEDRDFLAGGEHEVEPEVLRGPFA